MQGQRKNITWKNEKRKISELKPWAQNPRTNTEKQQQDLDNSINKFNLADPIIINTDNTQNQDISYLLICNLAHIILQVPFENVT